MEENVENQNQEQQIWIKRKIEVNQPYKIFVSSYNDFNFYKIQLKQKMYDGTEFKTYCPVKFKKGMEVENGTTIKIKQAIENIKPNPKDKWSYITEYMILDYEIATDTNDAINEFNQTIYQGDGLQLSESELPW